MSGIYIHIPFCKQACHYCDFYFTTSVKRKDELVLSLVKELRLRKEELEKRTVETIYFGGGTPSLLTGSDLKLILGAVFQNYAVATNPEITLEANPDDVSKDKVEAWRSAGINRVSLGIQSFNDKDLKIMNRAHDAQMALSSIKLIKENFENFSIDLIYGLPDMSNAAWGINVEKALEFQVPHLSAYALTVEPKTALKHFIKQGLIKIPDEDLVATHFNYLVGQMEAHGYSHYEISNFGKPGYFSNNNVAYWQGIPYLGIGPSAHSFNGRERAWNVRNHIQYIEGITKNHPLITVEHLSKKDRYNELIMTGLRTMWGVSLDSIAQLFGADYREFAQKQAIQHIEGGLVINSDNTLYLTSQGKFLADGIASDLFMVNLK